MILKIISLKNLNDLSTGLGQLNIGKKVKDPGYTDVADGIQWLP